METHVKSATKLSFVQKARTGHWFLIDGECTVYVSVRLRLRLTYVAPRDRRKPEHTFCHEDASKPCLQCLQINPGGPRSRSISRYIVLKTGTAIFEAKRIVDA
ncbi:unnamed protein product [Dibothriocephalus latus]|uniref:Uncharacterized protein n=1 Tax=Dibothriocephalus latus TaxID=60516 RepID=A0A3P7LWL8_DIBLA|nr:unnamed protein product [Dibothriocephalus latus]